MCTTCLRASACAAARSSRRARPGPRAGRSLVDPDLLLQLAAQRLDERLAGVHAAAREQPVLAVPAFSCRQRRMRSCQRSTAETRIRGSAPSSVPRGAEAALRRARSPGSSSTSTSSTLGHGQDDELRDPHPGLDDERLVAVGVQEDDAQLAPVARSRRGRASSRPRSRASPRGPSAAGRSPRSPRGSRPRARSPTTARSPGASSTRSQAARSRPASPAYARVGKRRRPRAQPRDRELDHGPRRGAGAARRRRGTRANRGQLAARQPRADEHALRRRPRAPRSARRARTAPQSFAPSS